MKNNLVMGIARRFLRTSLTFLLRTFSIPRRAGVTNLRGYGLQISYPDRLIWLNQFKEIFCDDCYRLCAVSTANPIFVDIGANVGMFTLFAKWKFPNSTVIAVEPSNDNLVFFKKNLRINGINDVQIVEAAVTNAVGSVSLNLALPSDSIRVSTGAGAKKEVQAVTLETLVPPSCDVLKMDIEGSELPALESGLQSLLRVDRLCVEYHEYRDTPPMLGHVLNAIMVGGFKRLDVDGHRYFSSPNPLSYCCLIHAWR